MARRAAFSSRLLAWYDRHRRPLPWRGTADPWAIWVSEVMLQQTRVEVVREAYPGFLARFPDPSSCAEASDAQLLGAWRGLGYYRRARLLRDGVRAVLRDHGGVLPRDATALGQLPGIGKYTRGAIASIAFQRAEPAVDGNVERVIARHRAILGNIKRSGPARAVRETVLEWMDRKRPGDFNQALMELGATLCIPRSPRCNACPVAMDCEARRKGLTETLPRLPARRPVRAVQTRAALAALPDGRILCYRNPSGRINGGQLELPGPGLLQPVVSAEELARSVAQRFAVRLEILDPVATVRHCITQHRIALTVHEATLLGPTRTLLRRRPDDPAEPWTTASRKVFRKLSLNGDRSRPAHSGP